MNFTAEQIEQAKAAANPEELMALAKDFGVELDIETATAYFAQLHPKNGELSDDELDNVSGGGCDTSNGHTIVTSMKKCFTGKYECSRITYFPGSSAEITVWTNTNDQGLRKLWWDNAGGGKVCGTCKYLEFTGGTGYCSKS